MLRIFVTGDNHIGLKYANHEARELLVKTRVDAFGEMVKRANGEGCGLFVITGDLFHNNSTVSKKELKAVLDRLKEFCGTVVYLPGNHDFYDEEAPLWKNFDDVSSLYDNVLVLKRYQPYTLEEAGERIVLYPALCTAKHSASGENNLGWIKETEITRDGAYHIGLAHGAVEGETIDSEGVYFPMKRGELAQIPVDVWLIGHTHVPFPRGLTESYSEGERVFNPGTHVQTDVNCNTEGQCFILEIGEDKTVRAKKYVPSDLRFYRKEVSLEAGDLEGCIDRALRGVGENSVVELILCGAVTEEEYAEKEQVIRRKLSRFPEWDANTEGVSRLITEELIDREFPETSLHAKFLKALLSEPKEAHMAYELLEQLKEEM